MILHRTAFVNTRDDVFFKKKRKKTGVPEGAKKSRGTEVALALPGQTKGGEE
jgi:hypothetical protein